ncbi:MAG: CoB--CoM heterodisulfide reductase iron-sulfur subunit B family protein [Syntrophomonadaceae bacterium]
MNVAYFPGCSLHSMAHEYDLSTRLVCRHLNINLKEIEDWNCCGATAAHSLDHNLAVGLAARNLSIAQQMNLDRVTAVCAGCFSRLKSASYEMRHNPRMRSEVEAMLQEPAPLKTEVQHLLQLLVEEVGLDAIKQKVVKPLQGLRLAAYYGCLLTRPRQVVNFDDPEQPVSLDHLLQALGAETVTWGHKAECCGGGYAASDTGIVLDLGGQVIKSAKNAAAEAIVVACPMCQGNLDMRQKAMGLDYRMPIIYFTQLMGLAFGYKANQVGINKLFNSPIPLLKSKGLV